MSSSSTSSFSSTATDAEEAEGMPDALLFFFFVFFLFFDPLAASSVWNSSKPMPTQDHLLCVACRKE
jgi:hypothetical protein